MSAGEVESSWSSKPCIHQDTFKSGKTVEQPSWKSSVSRAITFGSPRSEKVSAFVHDQFESTRWSDRNRWDFDFVSETPAKDGRYEWKSQSCSSSATSGDIDAYYGYRKSSSSSPFANTKYK